MTQRKCPDCKGTGTYQPLLRPAEPCSTCAAGPVARSIGYTEAVRGGLSAYGKLALIRDMESAGLLGGSEPGGQRLNSGTAIAAVADHAERIEIAKYRWLSSLPHDQRRNNPDWSKLTNQQKRLAIDELVGLKEMPGNAGLVYGADERTVPYDLVAQALDLPTMEQALSALGCAAAGFKGEET